MNNRLVKMFFATLLFCVACPSLPAQTAPQFIARRDIKLSGEIIAEAGDVVRTAAVDGDRITLVLTDGKFAYVKRADLADINEAVAVLTSLIGKQPKDVRLHSSRSSVHAIRGELPQAISDATKAIELSESKDAGLFVNRGGFYSSGGDYDKAIADYQKAIEVDAASVPARTNLVAAHIARQEYDKAVEVCADVLRIDDTNAAHYVQRGVAYRHLENWDAAIADFSKALELDNENLAALGSRGFVNYLKGDHASAVKDFDAIIRLTPDDAMAYNNRGYNAYLSGDYQTARADYEKATSLLPTYAMAWQNKAWLLATCPDDSIRNGEAAVTAAKKACDNRQTKIAADIKALAAAYAESGDFEKAIEHQTSVVGLVPDDSKPAEEEILATYKSQQPWRTTSLTAADRQP